MEFKYIIWAIIIILAITVIDKGFNKVKEAPFKETLDTGTNTIKSIFDFGKDVVSNDETEEDTEKTNLGMIPCTTDEDCDLLNECDNNCSCQEGNCFK